MAKKEVKRLRAKVEKLTEMNGVTVDEPLHNELSTIVSGNDTSIEKDWVHFEGYFGMNRKRLQKLKTLDR